jgi:predicted GNAT family acetyltransferase
METINITRHDAGQTGEYRAHLEGREEIGVLTWVRRGNARVAEHTLVPTAIGGRGVAAKLVAALIEDAREQNFRIVPACSYVAVAFQQHPEWADLKA